MRLSTRDLFAILTFVAVISWCAGRVGFDNPQFWIAAVISFVLAAFFIRWSGYRDGRTAALLAVTFFTGFCTLPFSLLASFFSALLLVLAILIGAAAKITSTRVRCGIAMVCVSAAFVLATSYGNADFNRIAELRELFPIESLENRLAYEGKQPSTEAVIGMTPAMNAKLTEDEQIFQQRDWRTVHLRQIHDREYEQFVRASGFGISRLGPPRKETIEVSPLRDIDFANAALNDEQDGWISWHAGDILNAESPIDKVHDASRIDFLDPEGYGNILAPRTKVVRFVPHAFHHHPLARSKERPKWSIDRIELVSLLKFDGPRVYVLDHLPRMDQLSSNTAPTRELNEFEASALEKLRLQEDLVVQSEGAEYQMLGSLRAAKQCLDCHNVQRGELLGAFSYRLTLAEDDSEHEGELAAKDIETNE
ncbi:MAG: hypothetical protein C0485_12535 [Pirellula sp.]|nr:hypothetical protein [Pirellula sp.]